MSRLKILLRGAQISDVALNPDREYIGGRKESCDIRLQPEKGISREHFKLKFEDGRWTVTSLSRFGEIYTLGQRSENFMLEHAQIFQIPPYEFHFSDLAEPEIQNDRRRGPAVSDSEKTVIGATQQVPYVKMMTGSGEVREMLRLEVGDTWVAGRDPSCQIVIPDQRVSRRQFELRKINGIYTLIDLGSVNGTFLNGSPVSSSDPQPLKSGDAISVLDNMMYFELHDPNFQYRMDRIEVPPLHMAMGNMNEASAVGAVERTYLPEIEQYGNHVQLDPNGSPFTGMPGAAPDANQFYKFAQTPQPPPPPTAWQKFKSNKMLMVLSSVIFLGLAFFASEYFTQEEATHVVQNPADPFSNLKPAEQKMIIELYGLAQKSMLQQKYSFAKENLERIHKLLPKGYKDSLSMQNDAETNENTINAKIEQDRIELENAERLKMFNETITQCEKLIGPKVTVEIIEECAIPIIQQDPSYPPYIRLRETAEKIVMDRQNKADAELSYQSQVAAMNELFSKAEKIQAEGYPYKAIRAYKLVVNSILPDPEGFKKLAKKRIQFIESKVAERTEKNIKQAETFAQEGKLKQAIEAFRAAQVYDPDNKILKEKIDKYMGELRRQVMVIYQESVIDENFGNVDGGEARPGAKEKWKKILEMDLDDGEYYRKAFIKLRKYGAL